MKKILFAVALLLSVVSYGQSSYYLPTVTKLKNGNVYSVDSAFFLRSGNSCYVYGRFTLSTADSVGQVVMKISVPFQMVYNVHHVGAGNCFVFQPDAGNELFGLCVSTFLHEIQLSFNTPDTRVTYVDYFFTFQVNE